MMNSTSAAPNTTTEPVICYPEVDLNSYFFALHLVVILIGIPSNAFSLYVSCQRIRQENELGVYLFNLALSDLCFIAGLPIWMDFTYTDKWRYGKIVCTVCAFFLFTNFYTSALLLSCIALDRYFAVVHPLSFPFLRKPSTAAAVSVAVWTLTLMFNFITIYPEEIFDDQYKVCLDVLPLPERQRKVHVARFFVGFFLPAVVVVFCYWRIWIEVCNNQATRLPERRRIFKLLASVLLSLCLCFGPIHISMVLRAALEDCEPPAWLFYLYKAGMTFSTFNCLADPILYCFITRTARASVTQALLQLQTTQSTGTRCSTHVLQMQDKHVVV